MPQKFVWFNLIRLVSFEYLLHRNYAEKLCEGESYKSRIGICLKRTWEQRKRELKNKKRGISLKCLPSKLSKVLSLNQQMPGMRGEHLNVPFSHMQNYNTVLYLKVFHHKCHKIKWVSQRWETGVLTYLTLLGRVAFPPVSKKGGLFKKQLGAYTKQFAGSGTPQAQPVKGLSPLIYHAVAFTRQHN